VLHTCRDWTDSGAAWRRGHKHILLFLLTQDAHGTLLNCGLKRGSHQCASSQITLTDAYLPWTRLKSPHLLFVSQQFAIQLFDLNFYRGDTRLCLKASRLVHIYTPLVAMISVPQQWHRSGLALVVDYWFRISDSF